MCGVDGGAAGDVGREHRRLRPYHYRYESGREGDGAARRLLAAQGQLSSTWSAGSRTGTRTLLEQLGPHKTGKGCLYLKRLADVDRDALRDLVEGT